mmetsp:Transcript_63865/g.88734  ORF Transcript_63865/g.88734 Transcript_63865/m.88734 type:complete len:235 (+) Transcript_63865:1376-2080(+)
MLLRALGELWQRRLRSPGRAPVLLLQETGVALRAGTIGQHEVVQVHTNDVFKWVLLTYVNIEADDSRKAQGSEQHDVAAPLCENVLSCFCKKSPCKEDRCSHHLEHREHHHRDQQQVPRSHSFEGVTVRERVTEIRIVILFVLPQLRFQSIHRRILVYNLKLVFGGRFADKAQRNATPTDRLAAVLINIQGDWIILGTFQDVVAKVQKLCLAHLSIDEDGKNGIVRLAKGICGS